MTGARHCIATVLLIGATAPVVGCSSHDDLSRPFSLTRDAPGDTARLSLPPLSMPPNIGDRPLRPGASSLPAGQGSAAPATASVSSPGQQAFLDAAGGTGSSTWEIRQQMDTDARLARPSPQFVSELMNWTPPPGYSSLFQPPRKGWLGRLF